LTAVFERYGESVVALEQVPRERVSKYGVVDGKPLDDSLMLVKNLVEKPAPEDAPSDLVIASRYVLTPDIFGLLAEVKPGKNGEIQLTDALRAQALRHAIYGLKVAGERFDAGDKLGFLKTNIMYALDRPDMRGKLEAFIRELMEN